MSYECVCVEAPDGYTPRMVPDDLHEFLLGCGSLICGDGHAPVVVSTAEYQEANRPTYKPVAGDRVSYPEGPTWLDVWATTDQAIFGLAHSPGVGKHEAAWSHDHEWFKIGEAQVVPPWHDPESDHSVWLVW